MGVLLSGKGTVTETSAGTTEGNGSHKFAEKNASILSYLHTAPPTVSEQQDSWTWQKNLAQPLLAIRVS